MKEVWQKASVVKQLKQSLQSKLNMVVNEDKLDMVLGSAKKQFNSINENFLLYGDSSHSLALPNRNTIAKTNFTMPNGKNEQNEYLDMKQSQTVTADYLGSSK